MAQPNITKDSNYAFHDIDLALFFSVYMFVNVLLINLVIFLCAFALIIHLFFSELYSQAWVQWHWHYYSTDCELHQPPGEASDGPCAGTEGERLVPLRAWVAACNNALALEAITMVILTFFFRAVITHSARARDWEQVTGGSLTKSRLF